jgi:Xaa-Pro aminopeptidase
LFVGLDTISLAPIKTDLVKVELLMDTELNWLNSYNNTVHETLKPLMEQVFPQSVEYLVKETKPLYR